MKEYPLGYVATKLALTHEYGEDKLITVTAVKGSINYPEFLETIRKLFTSHPALQCSLYKEPSRFFLKQDIQFESIPIIHIDSPDFSWREYVQAQLKIKFNLGEPLWGLTLLSYTNDTHFIIVSFHHSITDGISAAEFIHQLLNSYVEPSYAISPGHFIPQPEELYKHKKALQAFKEIINMPTIAMPSYARQAMLSERETRQFILALKFSPLKAFCDKSQCTFNALLTTLLILTIFQIKESLKQEKTLLISSCADLRKRIDENKIAPSEMACLFHSFSNIFKETDFSQKNIVEKIKLVDSALKKSLTESLQPPIGASIEDINAIFNINKQLEASSFSSNLDLSNVGRISLKRNYKNLETLAYFFFVNQILGYSEIVFCCSTSEDETFCTINYTFPLYEPKTASLFYHQFLENLKTYIPDCELIHEWSDEDTFLEKSALASHSLFQSKKEENPALDKIHASK